MDCRVKPGNNEKGTPVRTAMPTPIKTTCQTICSPTNRRCRPRKSVAAAAGETHTASLSQAVSLFPETVRGKPHSFRRPVRCRSGRLARCLQAIARIRPRQCVVSPAPAERFSDSQQRRGICQWGRTQEESANSEEVAHRIRTGDYTHRPLGSRCVASK